MGGLVVETLKGIPVVLLVGEHDVSTVFEIDRVVEAALEQGAAVIVDLHDTTFIDAAVVNCLNRLSDRAVQLGRQLMVVVDESPDNVAHLLLLGLLPASALGFPVLHSRAIALECLTGCRSGPVGSP